MAKVQCGICSKTTDSGYNGVKWCPNCQLWLCFEHGGPGATRCPKCKKESLR
jgi:hypothetical protein